MGPKPVPLPPIAREARALKLSDARWLVQVARKDANLEALAGLCRDRRVGVRKDAAYGLIAFLVNEAAADRDRLAAWWETRIGNGGVSSDHVPKDLPDLYEHARGRFVTLLDAQGVREPERDWRRRNHAFKCGLHSRASAIVDKRRREAQMTTPTSTPTPTTEA